MSLSFVNWTDLAEIWLIVIQLTNQLIEKKVGLISLNDPIDTSTAQGWMMSRSSLIFPRPLSLSYFGNKNPRFCYSMLFATFGLKMISLDKMGRRICIIGCSNSGKSTLADRLSKKLKIPAHHLDQYAYVENSNWQRKSNEVLLSKHGSIIHEDEWIIDGNYSFCMDERMKRATFVIWLDPNICGSVFRYLSRSFKNDPDRPGRLAGAKKEFSLWLIKWIIFNYPKNRKKYHKVLEGKPNLPVLRIITMGMLKKYYKFWAISYI